MRTRVLARLLVVGVVTTVAVAALASPAAAAPALQVTPDTDLVDFQPVTVSGSGFSPGITVGMAQCLATATDETGCDLSNAPLATTDETGSFTTTFVVERLITVGGEDVDCAPDGCAIGAANLADFTEAAFVLLSFDPTVPPQPRLDIDLAVAGQGTFDPRTGTATITGTVTCSEPAFVGLFGQVRQAAGRAVIIGDFFAEVACDGVTEWQATTSSFASGLFKGGKATVDAVAFGSAGPNTDQDQLTTTVKLKAG
jgi:hypothetical protein